MAKLFSHKENAPKQGKRTYSCSSCGLYKTADSPKMEAYGNFNKGILNIGKAPGEAEDVKGKPWQGKSGRFLKRVFAEYGIDLFEDCLNINAVNCKPLEDKAPDTYQIACCWYVKVSKIINEYQPKIIILHGVSAVQSFIGLRWKTDLKGINRWRGWTIPDQDFKCWVVPIFHPDDILDDTADKQVELVWKQDIQRMTNLIGVPWKRSKKPEIEVIGDLSPLKNITSGIVAFDYETTGLKPQAKGHEIVAASVADTEDHCYAFLMPKIRVERLPLINLLMNINVLKMAHNIKFEDTWTRIRLGCTIKGWFWDSMIAAHILDNRDGITSLKFQAYVQFGIIDYASAIEPYIKSSDGRGNSFNRIKALSESVSGHALLMEYVGMDSIQEYRLAVWQQDKMDHDFLPF